MLYTQQVGLYDNASLLHSGGARIVPPQIKNFSYFFSHVYNYLLAILTLSAVQSECRLH